jgi:uncharacterized protein YcbK (DUF882 family)
MPEQSLLGRREALRLGGGAFLAAGVTAFPALAATPIVTPAAQLAAPAVLKPASPADVRRAVLFNLHTGDRFNEVYWADGSYVPGALSEAMKVMRDWRNGEEHYIDPKLFDALHAINTRLETSQPFQIISGYRSPKTNAMLHSRSSGVASNSQHTHGKAIDVRVAGVDLKHLHNAALDVAAGGVGYYPVSNFVHVDTARVRRWTGA